MTKPIQIAIFPLLLGLFFCAASLTPSLIPRDWQQQALLCGGVAAAGYALGRLVQVIWTALAIPVPGPRTQKIAFVAIGVGLAVHWVIAVLSATRWQAATRPKLGMPPFSPLDWLFVILGAVVIFAVLFAIGAGIKWLFLRVRDWLYRRMPRRSANLLGFLLVLLAFFVLTRDGLVPLIYRSLDTGFVEMQRLFDDAPPAPEDPRMPGSAASHVDWQALGQPGRNFVTEGPDAAAITALTGRPAQEPIRVYVGLAQADTPEARAEIALEELKRLNAFDREVLVVATPTGTGWLDPGAMDTVDYIHDGDIATVAVQYSYMQSPFALIFQTDRAPLQATATLRVIMDHWRSLPRDSRPRLYLHGLSLGAWSSIASVDVFDSISDPMEGAFWVGTPFVSDTWRRMTERRTPGSPFVNPVIADGALARFMSQYGGLDRATAPWSDVRVIFLQYGSDAITFYEPASLWRAPEWMNEPLAPDVWPGLRFWPVVTQFQLAVDMMLAERVPAGQGHHYAADDYLDGWIALTDPEGWTPEDTEALKALCAATEAHGCGG
ncbi:alpha/beta hydrolase [Pseudooceanicola sp. LIPI14-2-Ac024]|uniref:alpha/beta hydrolase n=1 Tax=Pseudooceanicola sp. LIPI14-2-Ac024 TaxID=3344875 RepID=UPI0035CFBF49